MNILMYKIGHDENNKFHMFESGIFKSWINNSRRDSQYYEPRNIYESEFSSIKQILGFEEDDLQYVGICHYRTLIGELYTPTYESYKSYLIKSQNVIENTLSKGNDAIISTPYPTKYPNWITRSRWTGSKSLEYIMQYCNKIGLASEFNEYLNSLDSSYRTVCVLPCQSFYQIFKIVSDASDYFYNQRKREHTLFDRSVGYDLETLTSFLLVLMIKNHWIKVARIPHTIIPLVDQNGNEIPLT